MPVLQGVHCPGGQHTSHGEDVGSALAAVASAIGIGAGGVDEADAAGIFKTLSVDERKCQSGGIKRMLEGVVKGHNASSESDLCCENRQMRCSEHGLLSKRALGNFDGLESSDMAALQDWAVTMSVNSPLSVVKAPILDEDDTKQRLPNSTVEQHSPQTGHPSAPNQNDPPLGPALPFARLGPCGASWGWIGVVDRGPAESGADGLGCARPFGPWCFDSR
jgi:hypothetical protein